MEYYFSGMRRLRKAIRKKRLDLWKDNSWSLHYDNAPLHLALKFHKVSVKNSFHILPQLPYLPKVRETSGYFMNSKTALGIPL